METLSLLLFLSWRACTCHCQLSLCHYSSVAVSIIASGRHECATEGIAMLSHCQIDDGTHRGKDTLHCVDVHALLKAPVSEPEQPLMMSTRWWVYYPSRTPNTRSDTVFVQIILVIGVAHWTGTKIALIWSSRAPDVIGSGDVISWVNLSFLYC